MMTGFDIRAAGSTELTRLLTLAAAFYLEDGFATPVSQLRDNLAFLLHSHAARVAVAGRQHDIVGFAITTLSFGLEYGAIAELEDLFVAPASRGSGIATALIDDSCDWARSRGCQALEVVVVPKANDVAHLVSYYAKRNFADQGRKVLTRDLTR